MADSNSHPNPVTNIEAFCRLQRERIRDARYPHREYEDDDIEPSVSKRGRSGQVVLPREHFDLISRS